MMYVLWPSFTIFNRFYNQPKPCSILLIFEVFCAEKKTAQNVVHFKSGRALLIDECNVQLLCLYLRYSPELSVGWVDPQVALGWFGSGMGQKFVF